MPHASLLLTLCVSFPSGTFWAPANIAPETPFFLKFNQVPARPLAQGDWKAELIPLAVKTDRIAKAEPEIRSGIRFVPIDFPTPATICLIDSASSR